MPKLDPAQLPDAEAQVAALAAQIRAAVPAERLAETAVVGIYSGGAWIAERLCELLQLPDEAGLIDISFYRDDFAEKGLHPQVKPTTIPFDLDGRHLILVDDVLYTGRTTRAAINELFDYGRPASVRLAVLADRGGRELPIAADFCVWPVEVAAGEVLVLKQGSECQLQWSVDHV